MARPKKTEGLLWFRIYSTARGTFDGIEDEKIGAALKAALRYFEAVQAAAADSEEKAAQAREAAERIEAGITDPITKIAFLTFKTGIEDSITAHAFNVNNGRAGQEAKQKNAQKQAQSDRAQMAPAQKTEAAGPPKMTEEQKKEHQKKVEDYLTQYGGPESQPQPVTKWENSKGA